jgi:hypothetical protein
MLISKLVPKRKEEIWPETETFEQLKPQISDSDPKHHFHFVACSRTSTSEQTDSVAPACTKNLKFSVKESEREPLPIIYAFCQN